MAGNPWDNDAIVSAAPPPQPLLVSNTQGVIERPGQPMPAYANVAPAAPNTGGNPWDADKVVKHAPPPTAAEAASIPAATAAISAAGGPLGVAPMLAAPVVLAGTGALGAGGLIKPLYDKLPDSAKFFLWQKIFENIPGAKLAHHLHEAISGGGEQAD